MTGTPLFLTISTMLSSDLNRLAERDALSGVVPLTLVHLLASYLRECGADTRGLLPKELDAFEPGELGRFSAEAFCQLLHQAAVRLDDPLLGLHLGQTLRTAHLGALGYVLQACDDLGAALLRIERYHRLVHDINPIEHDVAGGCVELRWGTTQGRPGALFDETGITAIVKLARELCGQRLPIERVDFVNPKPRRLQPYTAFFGCPVRFDQPLTRLVIPLSSLQTPLAQPDPLLRRLMEEQVDAALAQLPEAGDLAAATRRVVAHLAPHGTPELDQVAHELRLSPKVLYRRLAAQGHCYRDLREAALKQVAELHLRDRRLTLAEVGLLLGYSEQSAFTRAFKRWTGLSPLQWRQRLAPSTSR